MSKSKPKRKRPVAIGIRVSRPEAREIRSHAKHLGVSVGALCREAVLASIDASASR